MSSQKREIRRAAARLANLGKVVVVTESQDERLRASVQDLRTQDTYEAAAACPACRAAQAQSGDASALCQPHLARALGL
jgi:hypothetical protein